MGLEQDWAGAALHHLVTSPAGPTLVCTLSL